MEEKAAVYCRLSQDDGSVGESGSMRKCKPTYCLKTIWGEKYLPKLIWYH